MIKIKYFPVRTCVQSLFAFICLVIFNPVVSAQTADTIYINGRIYTVDEKNPWAEAFAVKDGKIIRVGDTSAVYALATEETGVIDLEGKLVMPGIHDLHLHPMLAGEKELFQCSFPFTFSMPEIIDRIKTCAAETPKGKWIRGGQWANELMASDTVPHKKLLDEITTDHPIYLGDSTVHGAWLNSRALEILGINRDSPDPPGGVIVRDINSDPTGVLLDSAAYIVLQKIPPYTTEQYESALEWAMQQLNRVGVTTIKDAIVDSHALQAYKALDTAGRLTMRVSTSLGWKASWTETHESELALIANRGKYRGNHVNTEFIKIFLDGIPPTHTAAMLEPYVADEEHGEHFTGKLIHTPAQLKHDVTQLDAQGLTIKIHSTGDRSVRVALDAFETARKVNGQSNRIHEVSHAEFIHQDDIPRFKELNVAAEMCPILWYPSPLVVAMGKVLGEKRANRFWPVKSLYDSGALVIYGSDWPSVVPDPNPWPGIEAMVTRRDPYTNTGDQLWAEQAIDLASAVRIFTRNGAIAAQQRDKTGSIEEGKYADFIVLDRNIFAIPVTEISNTQILKTFIGGQIVYQKH